MRNTIVAAIVAIVASFTSVATAQDGCYVDPYTNEYVCSRSEHTVVPRQPVCYPVWAQQCGYDGWGNYHCWRVEQTRCR